MTKIIQITPYYPPHLGGMEQRIRDLSEKLAKKGNDIEIFTSDIGTEKGKLKSTKNLKINYLKSLEFAHTPIIPSLFWNLMRIPKDSIMHVHVAQALVPEIVWLVSKIRDIPYISHIRLDVHGSGFFRFLLKPYKKIFLKKVLNDSRKTIVLTEDYKKKMMDDYSLKEEKVTVIPNATNFPITKIIKNPTKNKFNIISVGRLSKQKNIPLLINSIAKIKEASRKKIILHLVGDGEERKEIKKTIDESGLNKQVILHGRLEGKNLERLYSKSDLFILVSDGEGFSTSLLEAMASGVPIVASNVEGTKSVIKDNNTGLLVELREEDISKKIEMMLANEALRRKLAINGIKEVKRYSWDKIINKTEEIYKEILNENKHK